MCRWLDSRTSSRLSDENADCPCRGFFLIALHCVFNHVQNTTLHCLSTQVYKYHRKMIIERGQNYGCNCALDKHCKQYSISAGWGELRVVIYNSLSPHTVATLLFSGLFQAAVVITYTTYLTWSALSHEPDDLCNPPGYFISGYDQNTGLSLQGIVSGLFVFIMLIYASFSTAISASKLSTSTVFS